MRVQKIKSTKYSELLMTGDQHGPSSIHILTRVRPTKHGELFSDLLLKVAPEAYRTLGDAPACSPDQARAIRKGCADAVVHFCEEVAMAAMGTLQRNKAFGVTVPTYEALLEKLRGNVPDQFEDSADVVDLFGQQEREP